MYSYLQNLISEWALPYKRYQHQRLIHALRLGLSVMCASLLVYWLRVPHGEWVAITVFVVLGTLQYQGSITAKAFERIMGTIIGLCIGLSLLWFNRQVLHDNWLFFILIGMISATCGWKSLDKYGYAAMLAGLTMSMLLGLEGTNWQYEGLMRAINVVSGTLLALCASQLMPIKSTLMWRFTVADNLNACAKQLAAITAHKTTQHEQWLNLLAEQRIINARLVKARSLLGAMAQESKMSMEIIENMQQGQRSIVSSVNLLLGSMQKLPKPHLTATEQQLLSRYFFQLQHDLHLTALLLKGEWRQYIVSDFSEEDAVRALATKLPFEWQGFIWVNFTIRAELFTLLTLLQHTRQQWLLPKEWTRLNNT